MKGKEESWRDLLDSAIADNNDAKMWRMAGPLKGCPDSNSPNEAITHKDRNITSNKKNRIRRKPTYSSNITPMLASISSPRKNASFIEASSVN